MRVAVTGTTGYLGSCLAAALLRQGHDVLALARRDPDGRRTAAALDEVARGFGWTAPDRRRLTAAPWDLRAEGVVSMEGVDAVWHCAAHMSLAPAQLGAAHDANVRGTYALYDALARARGDRARFFHVSTAFVGGFGGAPIAEELLPAPRIDNPYLVSKWATELALAELARKPGKPPVVLVRPTLVGGHTDSGWYGGKPFGIYMYLAALLVAAKLGIRAVRLDLSPDIVHDYAPIDDFVANALALAATPPGEALTTFHFTGSEVATRTIVDLASELLHIDVGFGAPASMADWIVDAMTEIAKPIAGAPTFRFERGKLRALLGPRYRETAIVGERLRHLVASYFREQRDRLPAPPGSSAIGAVGRALDRVPGPLLRASGRRSLAKTFVARALLRRGRP